MAAGPTHGGCVSRIVASGLATPRLGTVSLSDQAAGAMRAFGSTELVVMLAIRP